MQKEIEGFREQLERLDALFPGNELLTMPQVCKLFGADRKTLLATPGFPAHKIGAPSKHDLGGVYKISKAALAKFMVR